VSPLILNAVIDWIISSLPKYVRLPVGPHGVNYLPFADDLVICAQTSNGLGLCLVFQKTVSPHLLLLLMPKRQQRSPFVETGI
jgi:hypothetical protein